MAATPNLSASWIDCGPRGRTKGFLPETSRLKGSPPIGLTLSFRRPFLFRDGGIDSQQPINFDYSRVALASLTRSARPCSSLPLRARQALSASLASLISTNAKPFERPVSLSRTILTRSTLPCASNNARSCGSVVLCGKLPTYRFFTIWFLLSNYY